MPTKKHDSPLLQLQSLLSPLEKIYIVRFKFFGEEYDMRGLNLVSECGWFGHNRIFGLSERGEGCELLRYPRIVCCNGYILFFYKEVLNPISD